MTSNTVSWEYFTRSELADKDVVRFKRAYVKMTGDLIAGMVLSQIVFWHLPPKNGGKPHKLSVKKDGHMWIAKTRNEWADECCITVRQVDRALKILKELGYIEMAIYKYDKAPTHHVRLLYDKFLQDWEKTVMENYGTQNSHNVSEPNLHNVQHGSNTKCKNDVTQSVTSNEVDESVTSITASTTHTDMTYRDSSPANAGAGDSDPTPLDSIRNLDPATVSVNQLRALLDSEAATTLPEQDALTICNAILEREQAGKQRSTMIAELERRIKGHYNNLARAKFGWQNMVDAVSEVLGVNFQDPGMGKKIGAFINNHLWGGPNPYTPEELQEFKEIKDASGKSDWQEYVSVNNLPQKLSLYREWKRSGKKPPTPANSNNRKDVDLIAEGRRYPYSYEGEGIESEEEYAQRFEDAVRHTMEVDGFDRQKAEYWVGISISRKSYIY